MKLDETKLAGLHYHHSAAQRGYISRKAGGERMEPYSGKFGTGYKVFTPRFDTTNYCTVSYYVQ